MHIWKKQKKNARRYALSLALVILLLPSQTGTEGLATPDSHVRVPAFKEKHYVSHRKRNDAQIGAIDILNRKINQAIRKDNLAGAENALKSSEVFAWMDAPEQDSLRAKIAGAYLYAGDAKSALRLSKKAADRSGARAPMAGWIAGLAYWQLQDHAVAAVYFEMMAASSYASEWQRAAGAYWAARCYEETWQPLNARDALYRAAEHPRTFYGLMAGYRLGLENADAGEDGNRVFAVSTGEYRIDPALVNAIIRLESGYNNAATSERGAVGLMQIMPETARYIAKKQGYAKEITHASLRNPATNLKVGQDYLKYLLKNKFVNGDMLSLLLAYNAGPGNLQKWKERAPSDDMLFLIETVPLEETRNYAERVMAEYWMNRIRDGQSAEGIAEISLGKPAIYKAADRFAAYATAEK